jgi:hypothetical protein
MLYMGSSLLQLAMGFSYYVIQRLGMPLRSSQQALTSLICSAEMWS